MQHDLILKGKQDVEGGGDYLKRGKKGFQN